MTTTDIIDPFRLRHAGSVWWTGKRRGRPPGPLRTCRGWRQCVRPLSVRSGTIQAEGNVVKLGRQTSYAEGFVRDGAGNLAVHATATFSMIGEQARNR
jgi:hypothetical protein